MSEVKKILDERGSRYGDFRDVADTALAIQNEIFIRGRIVDDIHIAAIQMIAMKLSRIANGDPNYVDSWTDIAGYAQLVIDELESREAQ